MKYIIGFLLIFVLIFHTVKLNAQSRLGILAGAGTTWYYGDMNDRILTSPSLFRYYGNVGLHYIATRHLGFNAEFLAGRVVGADSLAIQQYNLRRNLSFQSDIWSFTITANYKLITGHRFNPFITVGGGFFHFNPKAKYNGELIALQPLGTEGQYINGNGYPKPYALFSAVIPYGFGVDIPLSEHVHLRVEYRNHYTFTDYLDDVSDVYADSSKLAATPNGSVAVQMASNLPTGYPAEGKGRGNPRHNDNYSVFGFTFCYHFDKQHGRGSNSGGSKSGGVIIKKKRKNKSGCPAYH